MEALWPGSLFSWSCGVWSLGTTSLGPVSRNHFLITTSVIETKGCLCPCLDQFGGESAHLLMFGCWRGRREGEGWVGSWRSSGSGSQKPKSLVWMCSAEINCRPFHSGLYLRGLFLRGDDQATIYRRFCFYEKYSPHACRPVCLSPRVPARLVCVWQAEGERRPQIWQQLWGGKEGQNRAIWQHSQCVCVCSV